MTDTHEPVLIRRRGKESVALIAADELAEWVETACLLRSPKNAPRLRERYANLPMDLADASLVLAATDLGEGRILSNDERDFGACRRKDTEPFCNLLREAASGVR